MVHPALVGGLVASVAIAAILSYMYYEEHFSQNGYENISPIPVQSMAEDIDLGESSSEEGDDDALDRFAKRVGLRRRRKRTRLNPDENSIQEKYSHVTAMEQAMERRRRALEDERLEIERQEQDLARRRSLLSSTTNSTVGPYISPLSSSASASPPTSLLPPASVSSPASVTISLAESEDPFDDSWSAAAASAAASVHESTREVVSSMSEASVERSTETLTAVEGVVMVDEAGNQVAGPMSPRSTGSWEDLDQTM